MKKRERSLDYFETKCKEHGLRITPQRTVIYQALKDDYSHPSADDVYKKVKAKFPNISFDTVNRTCLSFVDSGIIRIAESHGRQKRFDPNIENHHHICCVRCGRIIDFKNKNFDALEIPGDIERAYTVLAKKVVLECICDMCRINES